MQNKPRLGFWQIWNMSFGFLGIQFGWGLQLANMSAIYTKLGANPDQIPILWLAGPVTGLLVQPIIGSLSDRTWNWLGRRRPYFTIGAILWAFLYATVGFATFAGWRQIYQLSPTVAIVTLVVLLAGLAGYIVWQVRHRRDEDEREPANLGA